MANAPVTRSILWANVGIYVAELLMSRSATALGETPTAVMLRMGANYTRATIGDQRYETLLTSSFLHFSIVHIAFNLYALRQIGPPIERNVGPTRMATMYLAAGIAGSAVSTAVGWFMGQDRLSAGASGAICGIIGAALVLGLRAEGMKSRLARAMARWLLMLLVIQFVAELAHVPAAFDNAAHFGGAAVGALFAASWRRGPPASALTRCLILGGSALLVVAAFAAVAWRDAHDPFVSMRADQRYELTRSLVARQACRPAREALAATARLVPRSPEVVALEGEYRATCGD